MIMWGLRGKDVLTVVGVGISLAAVLFAATFLPGPDLMTPVPYWILYVASFGEDIGFNSVVWLFIAVPILFVSWNWQLLAGNPQIPVRSIAAFVALLVASSLYLISRWSWVQSAGAHDHFHAICLINALVIIGAAVLWQRGRRKPSLWKSLMFHWLLFAWPLSYAFPYLTEAL